MKYGPIFLQHKRLKVLLLVLLTILPLTMIKGQKRMVQNRPYIDTRYFHYGFYVGIHEQSINLENNGYINPANGEQWFVENDRNDVGFSVGVVGEWKLTEHFSARLLPSLHFGNKHLVFREQKTGKTELQNLKSTYIALPLNIKFAGPRFNNYRPYVVAGVNPMYNLIQQKQNNILTKPFNCYLEVGMGCDFYLPFFKLIPELKFSFGLMDVLDKDRSKLTDQSKLIYTQSVNKGYSNMLILSLYFE